MKTINTPLVILGLAVAFVAAGCKDPNEDLQVTSPTTGGKESQPYEPMAAAGISKDVSKSQADATRLAMQVSATSRFGHRDNPFALSAEEKAFDAAQAAERMVIEGPAFGTLWTLDETPVPGTEQRQIEPQPYRRLSGILIGDSILAILEEGGRSTIIRPGMMIPDTEWRVVSIDRDKAILRRAGNRLPKEVEVRLEIGLPGTTPNPGGGAPGGFGPGTPPGGGTGGGPGGSRPD